MSILSLLLLAFVLADIQALQCWTCENQPSNEACNMRGTVRHCLDNQEACQNLVRRSNAGISISKQCKQARACDNNYSQNNKPAWDPMQCNTRVPSSMCTCCCEFDLCNVPELACLETGPTVPSNILQDINEESGCPPVEVPEFGRVTCEPALNEEKQEALIGTVCSFACDKHYSIQGKNITKCIKIGEIATFNSEPPVCTKVSCPKSLSTPEHGSKECSDADNVGSRCEFECDVYYLRVGSSNSTCVEMDDGIQWDNPVPVCRRNLCPETLSIPNNGSKECSDTDNVGSRCEFECDMYYTRVGSSNSTCVEIDDETYWNNPVPVCRRNSCPVTMSTPEHGSKECSDTDNVGSRCEFGCDKYYTRVGSSNSTCVEMNNEIYWNNPVPVCLRNSCPVTMSTPENGSKVCSDTDNVGSRCEFGCDKYYTRVGSSNSTCVEIDDEIYWNNPVPVCQAIQCETQVLRHGEVTCDNPSNGVGTTCTYQCVEPDHFLYPPNVTQATCLEDSRWSADFPCCTKGCPSLKLDFVVVLDSSSSVGIENWEIMKTFVRAVLNSFDVGKNSANLAVFRYNRQVDTKSEIKLKDYTNNKDELLKAFDRIPYDGSGTMTGRALAHARNVIFTKENGNREDAADVILMITDGRAQDGLVAGEVAKELREAGVIIYVLGIVPPHGMLDVQELIDIAGDKENVIVALGGFQDLASMFSSPADEQTCDNPCEE